MQNDQSLYVAELSNQECSEAFRRDRAISDAYIKVMVPGVYAIRDLEEEGLTVVWSFEHHGYALADMNYKNSAMRGIMEPRK